MVGFVVVGGSFNFLRTALKSSPFSLTLFWLNNCSDWASRFPSLMSFSFMGIPILKTMIAYILLVCSLLCGCGESVSQYKIAKTISEKLAATEQRVSFDPWDENSIRSRAETVYYLIAEDGTMIEVSLKDYAKAKVGETVESSQWR